MSDARNIASDQRYIETATLSSVATDVKHLAEQNNRLNARTINLEEKVSNVGKFNVPLFISAISLILGCLVVLGNMRLAPLEQNAESLAAYFQNHTSDGHPHTFSIKVQGMKNEIGLQLKHLGEKIERIEGSNQTMDRQAR